MSSAAITLRSGLYAETLAGLPRSGAELGTLLDERSLADSLGSAILGAIAQARASGLDAFTPDDALLSLPSSVPEAAVRNLFASVLGWPFNQSDELLNPELPAYGARTLAQWSGAADALAEHSARLGSMLAPGEGGGAHHARGQWFVNGQAYTLAELVMTIRMGNLNGLDKVLEADLNTMLANTTLARQLMSIQGEMKWRRGQAELEAAPSTLLPDLDAAADYQVYVEAAGLNTRELGELGTRFRGADSYLARSSNAALAGLGISGADYDDTINELQSLFDSINTENDVKRLQIQNRQNERTNMLEGMSTYYSGVSAVNQLLGQNIG